MGFDPVRVEVGEESLVTRTSGRSIHAVLALVVGAALLLTGCSTVVADDDGSAPPGAEPGGDSGGGDSGDADTGSATVTVDGQT